MLILEFELPKDSIGKILSDFVQAQTTSQEVKYVAWTNISKRLAEEVSKDKQETFIVEGHDIISYKAVENTFGYQVECSHYYKLPPYEKVFDNLVNDFHNHILGFILSTRSELNHLGHQLHPLVRKLCGEFGKVTLSELKDAEYTAYIRYKFYIDNIFFEHQEMMQVCRDVCYRLRRTHTLFMDLLKHYMSYVQENRIIVRDHIKKHTFYGPDLQSKQIYCPIREFMEFNLLKGVDVCLQMIKSLNAIWKDGLIFQSWYYDHLYSVSLDELMAMNNLSHDEAYELQLDRPTDFDKNKLKARMILASMEM